MEADDGEVALSLLRRSCGVPLRGCEAQESCEGCEGGDGVGGGGGEQHLKGMFAVEAELCKKDEDWLKKRFVNWSNESCYNIRKQR